MSETITVFVARRIHTMEERFPVAEAVAVRDGRVLVVGSRETVLTALGATPHVVDETLADMVLMPGLIDQHMHPMLAASTMATEVIATEDWVLPRVTHPAAHSADEYRTRLREIDASMTDPDEWLVSWGYHSLWHGPLSRQILDDISPTRPIGVWQRSAHEWFMNSAATERLGVTQEMFEGHGHASLQCDVENGHYWEAGLFNVAMKVIAPILLSRERMERGLHILREYLHVNGITSFNEPGIAWKSEPWDLYQSILGAPNAPFLSSFMVDARNQTLKNMDTKDMVADAEKQIARGKTGKVTMMDKAVKLFADGAIISQLIQMREPFLDEHGNPNPSHHGEWIMEPEALKRSFSLYWKAGWQIHTHVNGDRGLDVLLDIVEECQLEHPRTDHRCVIVHFGTSTEDQIERIARLGMIVSSNPYYPCGFADKFSLVGLGPDRADVMARNGSVVRASIPLSFHSDMPMAPSNALMLASYAVNRRTQSGRVAGPEQRVSVHQALRAVTIDAAYSWRQEHELGSIAPGKRATFSVLGEDPYEVDPEDLGRIAVRGVVFEGEWHPVPTVPGAEARASSRFVPRQIGPGRTEVHDHIGCACDVAQHLWDAYEALNRPAA